MLIVFLPILIPKCAGTFNTINTINENGTITKMNIEISYNEGSPKHLVITDAKKLDSINTALAQMTEIYVQQGEAYQYPQS